MTKYTQSKKDRNNPKKQQNHYNPIGTLTNDDLKDRYIEYAKKQHAKNILGLEQNHKEAM